MRPFTGRHMAMILIAGFGVVIAVNVAMARMAISTFGGGTNELQRELIAQFGLGMPKPVR